MLVFSFCCKYGTQNSSVDEVTNVYPVMSSFKKYLLLLLCVWWDTCAIATCGGQKPTLWHWFFAFHQYVVLWVKFRCQACKASIFTY